MGLGGQGQHAGVGSTSRRASRACSKVGSGPDPVTGSPAALQGAPPPGKPPPSPGPAPRSLGMLLSHPGVLDAQADGSTWTCVDREAAFLLFRPMGCLRASEHSGSTTLTFLQQHFAKTPRHPRPMPGQPWEEPGGRHEHRGKLRLGREGCAVPERSGSRPGLRLQRLPGWRPPPAPRLSCPLTHSLPASP